MSFDYLIIASNACFLIVCIKAYRQQYYGVALCYASVVVAPLLYTLNMHFILRWVDQWVTSLLYCTLAFAIGFSLVDALQNFGLNNVEIKIPTPVQT